MEQATFLRKIPEDMRPWECNVNGVKYVYPAGTEQNVPAEVAAIIDAYWEKQEVDYPETGISFNDLRDRPFGEDTEVLFDQRVEFAEVGSGMMVFDGEPIGLLETGKTYTVTYNGEKYNCVAFDASDDGTEVAIGNSVIFGMDTGEPFLIITGFDGGDIQEYFFSILSLNGDTSATIRIDGSVIHTIDPKFLPGGGVLLYADNSGYLYKSDVLSEENEVSMDEVLGYAKKGMTVVVTPYAVGERTDYQYAITIIKITSEEPNYARVLTGGDSYYHSKERVVNAAPPV